MYAKKNSGKKVFAMLLAVVLLIGIGVGGTLAWLQDTTATVTNTFTVGNIDIDLKEHELKADGTLDETKEVIAGTYKIIPGTSQPKDPFVRVVSGSEACWVFIKVEEANEAATYITYNIDLAVWTPLNDTDKDGVADDGVYYKEMPATTADETLNILDDEKVSYSDDLTKDQIDLLYNITKDAAGNVVSMTVKPNEDLPQLKFTAYAIQKVKGDGTTFTAADAWTELNK